ncbi:hypothetical protein PFISCL1PPCAC_9263, partial [Pristionchus fissidentatus]
IFAEKNVAKKKMEKGPPNANEIKLQPLILSAIVKEKKTKIDKYKEAIDDLTVRMERVAQPDPEVVKMNKLNEAEGANPYEMLANAFESYAKNCADQAQKNRLRLLQSQCLSAASDQRVNRDAMRQSMRHIRRFSVKEYKEMNDDYKTMEELLKQMDLARDAVLDCQDPNQLDRKAHEFKESIMQFELQSTHVLNQLNSFDAHIVNHAKNVVDFVSYLKRYYTEPKLSAKPEPKSQDKSAGKGAK